MTKKRTLLPRAKLDEVIDQIRKHDAILADAVENLPIAGLDWRGVVDLLQCSKQEFERWRDDGKFPESDGEVLSYTFTSMSRV